MLVRPDYLVTNSRRLLDAWSQRPLNRNAQLMYPVRAITEEFYSKQLISQGRRLAVSRFAVDLRKTTMTQQ